VAGFCKHSNELYTVIKGGAFFDKLRGCQVLGQGFTVPKECRQGNLQICSVVTTPESLNTGI
jgi:hypothetical protein